MSYFVGNEVKWKEKKASKNNDLVSWGNVLILKSQSNKITIYIHKVYIQCTYIYIYIFSVLNKHRMVYLL